MALNQMNFKVASYSFEKLNFFTRGCHVSNYALANITRVIKESKQAVRNARERILENGFLQSVCRSTHAQGGRTKRFSIVNFLKSSHTTYAYFLIFLNIRKRRSSDNSFSKSVKQILRYFENSHF